MVDVDVPADELPHNAGGSGGVVTLTSERQSGRSRKPLEGRVTYVSPQVETKNGAVMLGIDLPADPGAGCCRG